MEDFRLVVWGRDFDVDRCLSRASFAPSRVWHVGEPSPFEEQATTAGFEIRLAPHSTLEFKEQEEIAIRFLAEHAEFFHACSEDSGVQHSLLELPKDVYLDQDLDGFAVEIDQRLLAMTSQFKMRAATIVNLLRL